MKGASHNAGKETDTKLSTQQRILKVKVPKSFSLSDIPVWWPEGRLSLWANLPSTESPALVSPQLCSTSILRALTSGALLKRQRLVSEAFCFQSHALRGIPDLSHALRGIPDLLSFSEKTLTKTSWRGQSYIKIETLGETMEECCFLGCYP